MANASAFTVFKLDEASDLNEATLTAALQSKPLIECLGLSLSSVGFVDPDRPFLPATQASNMLRRVGSGYMFCLGRFTKKIPSSEMKRRAFLAEMEFEQSNGYKPGRKVARDLREKIATEMLPHLTPTFGATTFFIDFTAHLILALTSSASAAEGGLETLRNALGTLPVTRWEPATTHQQLLSSWVIANSAGHECTLNGAFTVELPGEDRQVMRCKNTDLTQFSDPSLLVRNGGAATSVSARLERKDLEIDFTLSASGVFSGVKSATIKERIQVQIDEGGLDAQAEREAYLTIQMAEFASLIDFVESECQALADGTNESTSSDGAEGRSRSARVVPIAPPRYSALVREAIGRLGNLKDLDGHDQAVVQRRAKPAGVTFMQTPGGGGVVVVKIDPITGGDEARITLSAGISAAAAIVVDRAA